VALASGQVLLLMFCAWKTACQIFLQATLLARDELTGSLVQVLLLAVGFEDGQGLILFAVVANQPVMHYGIQRLCDCCQPARLGAYSAVATADERVLYPNVLNSPAPRRRAASAVRAAASGGDSRNGSPGGLRVEAGAQLSLRASR
jgi:hypothetical protein